MIRLLLTACLGWPVCCLSACMAANTTSHVLDCLGGGTSFIQYSVESLLAHKSIAHKGLVNDTDGTTELNYQSQSMLSAPLFRSTELLALPNPVNLNIMMPSNAAMEGCRFVFLDIGANTGVHIRELFEPKWYPESNMLQNFDRYFGKAHKRMAPFESSGICAFGFEANPNMEPTLRAIEEAYTRMGWRVKMFVPFVVSDYDGDATFFVDQTRTVGSSIVDRVKDKDGDLKGIERNFSKRTLPAIDLHAFVNNFIVSNRPTIQHVFAKMDIEGAEYGVLSKMLTDGLGLCANSGIDAMTMEWHTFKPESCGNHCDEASIRERMQEMGAEMRCQPTDLLNVDDETYGPNTDPPPLPLP